MLLHPSYALQRRPVFSLGRSPRPQSRTLACISTATLSLSLPF